MSMKAAETEGTVKLTIGQQAVLDQLKQMGATGKYLERAVRRGLTADDIAWNARLGRPPQWIETVHPETEAERRKAWTAAHPAA